MQVRLAAGFSRCSAGVAAEQDLVLKVRSSYRASFNGLRGILTV
jgi:hypothetical protein